MKKPKKKPTNKKKVMYVAYDSDEENFMKFSDKKELDSYLLDVYGDTGHDSKYLTDIFDIFKVFHQLDLEVVDTKVEFNLKEKK